MSERELIISPRGKEQEVPISLFRRLEQGTQALLDKPQDIEATINGLRHDLQTNYRVRGKVDKYLHLVGKEAFFHLGGERFLEQAMPLLTSGPSALQEEIDSTATKNEFSNPFVGILSKLWIGAANSVRDEIKSDLQHPYRPLWDYAKESYDPYRKIVEKYEPARILDEEFEDHIYQALWENVTAVKTCLTGVKKDIGQDMSASELTTQTLANIDRLQWLASIDSDTFTVLSRHAASRALSDRVNRYTGDERTFALEDGVLQIVHPVLNGLLQDGPKDPPGTCTGLYSLSTPNSPHGKFDNVSLVFTAGAHLAKYTIFAG